MPVVELTSNATVRISAQDAGDFLQGILTCDLEALQPKKASPGALLSPQGKILFDFLISVDGDSYRLDTAAEAIDDFVKRLVLYRLRAKVEIEREPDIKVFAQWGTHPSGGLLDTRFPDSVGMRRIYAASAADSSQDISAYNSLRVAHGVAESGVDYQRGDAFPHDILLDFNQGVAFRKGCFIGQEVVSRMQHRNTARRRLVILQASHDLPEGGTPVLAGETPIGALGTVAGNTALAIIRTDRYAKARSAGVPVTIAGEPVNAVVPPYADFALSGDDIAELEA